MENCERKLGILDQGDGEEKVEATTVKQRAKEHKSPFPWKNMDVLFFDIENTLQFLCIWVQHAKYG